MADAKRILKGINFDFEGAHIALTDASQGGAASGMNDPYILKSLEKGVVLSDNQKSLLAQMGHTESEIDKSLISGKDPLPSPSEKGEGKLIKTKGTEDTMSENSKDTEVLLKSMADMEKTITSLKIEKALSPFELGGLSTDVADAMASLGADDAKVIVKAFGELVAMGEYGVAIAKATAEAKPDAENDLTKALQKEEGDSGEPEADAKTPDGQSETVTKALDALDVLMGKKGGDA